VEKTMGGDPIKEGGWVGKEMLLQRKKEVTNTGGEGEKKNSKKAVPLKQKAQGR